MILYLSNLSNLVQFLLSFHAAIKYAPVHTARGSLNGGANGIACQSLSRFHRSYPILAYKRVVLCKVVAVVEGVYLETITMHRGRNINKPQWFASAGRGKTAALFHPFRQTFASELQQCNRRDCHRGSRYNGKLLRNCVHLLNNTFVK